MLQYGDEGNYIMELVGKNIILEIIPTHSKSEYGYIVQLQALKLDGIKLIDRFDYRVIDDLILNKDLLSMISYDKDNFNYTENVNTIMKDFKKWCKGYKLLYMDNEYTLDYIRNLSNEKESIFNYLQMEFSNDIIEKIIDKYNLQPSNNIVDLLYEALIYESNNHD